MNLQHMKYAVVIAERGSLSAAAEALYIPQPNLSRVIKQLESELGTVLFVRSAKGMILTPEGEEYIRRARAILEQVDELGNLYGEHAVVRRRFSVSVPRASYIARAFARFTKKVKDKEYEFFYMETNALQTISNITMSGYHFGIIRYAMEYDSYFTHVLKKNRLKSQTLFMYSLSLVFSRESPLAEKEFIKSSDLASLIEVIHGDPYDLHNPYDSSKPEEESAEPGRRITLYERGSQLYLLSENHETFMWASQIPASLLNKYDLIFRNCTDSIRDYKDVLIYPEQYHFTALDRQFLEELNAPVSY